MISILITIILERKMGMYSRKERRLKKQRKQLIKRTLCLIFVLFIALSGTVYLSKQPSRQTKKQTIVTTFLPASNYENLQKTVVDFQSANSFDKLLTTKKFIGTALIIKNDQIILEKGYGYSNQAAHKKNTVHSHFQIGSIQKSITASLIAQLIEANKLSFQTKLAQFFPNISGSEQITIKQMLSMVSGLTIRSVPSDSTNEQVLLDEYIHQAYGTHTGIFHYAPINYNLLAGVIEKLTNQPYWNVVKNQLLRPGGLDHTNNYTDWFQRANHTTSYQLINQKDYAKAIHPSLNIYAREIGTGSIDMSIGDLYWYYRSLINQKFFSEKISTELYRPFKGEYYSGGLYVHPTYFRSRGEITDQQTLALFDKNAHTAVILMSNEKNNQLQMSAIQSIYSTISHSHVQF